MANKYLNKTGLEYFWNKLKAYFAPVSHTHTSYAVKHSYTTAANQAKAWLRIANANTHQMDTSKPLHVQFLLTAWNPDQPADHYEQWFVNCEVFGRNSGLQVFGNTTIPFSQIRVLYENTVADIDTNDRPAIDIYLNYVLATACHVEIQEVYNSGWTFLANGVLAASTIPTGFENRAVGIQGSGVHQATNASYTTYTSLQRSNITANITLANSDTYRMRVLNCTNAITVTVPSLDNTYAWFLIKNFNAASTNKNITIHPSTTSVLIDDSNADIILKPGEWVIIASKAANSYSLIGDSRWKSQKADKGTTLSDYGITDAKIANGIITLGSNSITPLTSHQTLPTLSRTISGSGNAITDITVSNHAITATKGTTFLTSHQSLADYAKLASPAFTGTPTAPTAAASTNNTQIATTAFVKSQGYLTSHQTLPTLSKTDSGSGNAVTGISVSNHAITVTKGSTFALDSNVIHKNSNEAIEGIKEFSNSYHDSTKTGETDWESTSLILRVPNYDKGTTPETSYFSNLLVLDKYGTNIDWGGRLGSFEYSVNPAGNYYLSLYVYKNEIEDGADVRDRANIAVGYDINGNKYAIAPSTSLDRSSDNDIITRDWIPKDTRIVHTSGDESVSGTKTFASGTLVATATSFTEVSLRSGDDAGAVRIWGGNTRTASAKMILAGTSFATAGYAGCFFFQATNGSATKELKGAPDGTLTWNGQTIQTASDERLKTQLSAVPDAVLDAWGNVQWGQFQFLDAVERKGNAARLHLGLIAQRVKAVFERHGLDACAYGILCHEEHEVAEDDSASDLWMVRYEEAQAMEAAYQRRRADRLEAKIALLEERLSALEAENPK